VDSADVARVGVRGVEETAAMRIRSPSRSNEWLVQYLTLVIPSLFMFSEMEPSPSTTVQLPSELPS